MFEELVAPLKQRFTELAAEYKTVRDQKVQQLQQNKTPNTQTPANAKLKFQDVAEQKHGAAFIAKVKQVAANLGMDPNWLMSIMWSESGLNPQAVNPQGGATGLIQFMPQTANALGTSTQQLYKMNGVQQLDYVEAFYKYWGKAGLKPQSAEDMYLLTFYPAAVGKGDNFVIGRRGDAVYAANAALDYDGDGLLTAGDFKKYIRNAKRLDGAFDGNNNAGNTTNNNQQQPQKQGNATSLSAPVGAGPTARNLEADVKLIQRLLNRVGANLDPDGAIGPLTQDAINRYQQSIFNGWYDGVVDPGGNTWKHLAAKKGSAAGGQSTTQNNTKPTKENPSLLEQGAQLLNDYVIDPLTNLYNSVTDNDASQFGVGAEKTDAYDSQLDNTGVWSNANGKVVEGHSQCNVTSLAMQLIGLHNGDVGAVAKQAKDQLKKLGITIQQGWGLPEMLAALVSYNNINLFSADGIMLVAQKYFGCKCNMYWPKPQDLSYQWFATNIIPGLQKGGEAVLGAMFTSGGHIVSVKGVRKDGIVINDPYGACLAKGIYLQNGLGCYNSNIWAPIAGPVALQQYQQSIASRLSLNGRLQEVSNLLKQNAAMPKNIGQNNFYTWAECQAIMPGDSLWIYVASK